ncbi:Aldehyde dehydrogenase [Taphrina deformans PYCC 5710]|uniref:Aldehyde dehydrogenase n=1 Tax=Taphrina deformans (strain PYCC 5710 / ATCC 11124 / CBS 356.35 / IMI 108563 / JCM 9778 / NBRC 8474) TaxID=1097556 RepID=R4XAT5_TAPDE|nr:Aldehyde dehydrogenase [Taphrina deformans PYCC 5710]|eukprot:CCG81433.1 Aldehyde dehydrogenase [Taphrina deformans PYCC 5710]
MSSKQYTTTPIADIDRYVQTARTAYLSNRTKPLEYRKTQLKKLFEALDDNLSVIQESLAKDFGKPGHEVYLTECLTLQGEIMEVLHDLPKWMKPRAGLASFPFNLSRPQIFKEPLGVSLIIGAWNYPLFVTFGPLIGAIAAGCPAILKPSELAPNCAMVMQEIIHRYLDNDCYRVVQGAIPETTHLLNEQKWDSIFYTGGGAVGRIVAAAGAKNLTPVTLELGGKNAVIITKNADLKLAARRVAWGKFTNAGQTCVAPDYILFTDPGLEDKFTEEFRKQIADFYPEESWRKPGTFTRIVNENHFKRIKGLLDATSGQVVLGGHTDLSQRLIEPTLVGKCNFDDSLMTQEIFGPVLPMLQAKSLDDAISTLQHRDKSLALYVFTNQKSEYEKLFHTVQSGGAMINDTMAHCGLTGLPFGGVGESGTGAHGGAAGFDSFSHTRSIVKQPTWFEYVFASRYAPYTPSKIKQLKMIAPKKYWNKDYSETSFAMKLLRYILGLSFIFAAYRYIKPRLSAKI